MSVFTECGNYRRSNCRAAGESSHDYRNRNAGTSSTAGRRIASTYLLNNLKCGIGDISIIVENPAAIEELNHYLHEAGEYIIGRMGIPYREKGINIISIAIDAPQDMISALSGKIGRLNGVSTKTAYSNVITKAEEKAE